MISGVLVALGAVVGAVALAASWQAGWGWRQIVYVNTGVSALAGALAGALIFSANQSVLALFLGFGVLQTAAPFASVLLPFPSPQDASEAWRLIRRTCGLLALNCAFCATAASAAYILFSGGAIYIHAR